MNDEPPKSPAERLTEAYIGIVPHNRELGIDVVHTAKGMAILKLPYDERLIGNPDTGVVHGGAVTTLIDAACGFATITATDNPQRIATLDLRIDYLRPARPQQPLFARAETYHLARDVAFVRAQAYQDDSQKLIAHATGTFMFVGKGAGRRKSALAAGTATR